MGRLRLALRDYLDRYLPPNAHERCSDRTHVAVTRVLPYWKPELISKFETRQELLEALLTSCHIPFYFDYRWATRYRCVVSFRRCLLEYCDVVELTAADEHIGHIPFYFDCRWAMRYRHVVDW